MKIAILLGSVRNNREGNRVGKFAKKITEERGWEIEIVDPVEYELPMLEQVYRQMKNPEEKFVKIHNILQNADGFIMVTAEYNHSIPPALKNLIDHFYFEYFYKPTAIISYSSSPFGGVRAAEQLKLICSELRTIPIPISLPISKAHESLNDDGTSVNGDYERRSKKFLDEFQWYLEALKNQREKGIPSN